MEQTLFVGAISSGQIRCWFGKLVWHALALPVAWSVCDQRCAGFELALPAVSSDVNYDFHAETPDFEITHAASPPEILAARLTFADGNFLRVTAVAGEFLLSVDLTLRAQGILDLFEPTFISFDESLSLLRKDGSILATSEKNSGFGYDDDVRDYVFLRWQFDTLADSAIHGLEWHITPDLVPGAELPETVGLDIRFSSARAVLVVPESSSAAMVLATILCEATRRRRRSPDR